MSIGTETKAYWVLFIQEDTMTKTQGIVIPANMREHLKMIIDEIPAKRLLAVQDALYTQMEGVERGNFSVPGIFDDQTRDGLLDARMGRDLCGPFRSAKAACDNILSGGF
jgi:hypothetical protein